MDLDMADVRPTVLSFLTVTVMAIVGIVLVKYLANTYPLFAPVRDFINAV